MKPIRLHLVLVLTSAATPACQGDGPTSAADSQQVNPSQPAAAAGTVADADAPAPEASGGPGEAAGESTGPLPAPTDEVEPGPGSGDETIGVDAGSGGAASQAPGDEPSGQAEGIQPVFADRGWQLVWSDEFDGTQIDLSKWTHAEDCLGGGNNEDQCYVADAKNSFVRDGELHLVALPDAPSGPRRPGEDDNVVSLGHSSGKLVSQGKGDFLYGRIEARARVPFGQGIWPAIWMMPTDSVYGGWAQSGEIDIMEAINLKAAGAEPNRVHGTLHYGGGWPGNVYSGTHYDPPTDVTAQFHTYAVEWEAGEIRWYVDDVHYATQNDWYSEGNAFPAPFDQRFYVILNLAVGGNWPGYPDGTTTFPQELVLDYVRVFECAADPNTGAGCGTRDPGVAPL